MKLNRTMLVAVMALGSLGAVGCKHDATTADADQAAAVDQASPAVTTDDANLAVDATVEVPAPPALKDETRGPAPTEHHVWSPGYWHYDHVQTVYLWEPGYWQDRTIVAPVAPPPLRDETVEYRYAPAGEYFWAPGSWRWTGVEYTWAPGYWAPRMEGWGWVRPYWVSYGGRWECHGWGWERRTAGWAWSRFDWSRRGWSSQDRAGWEREHRTGFAQIEHAEWGRREHDHRVHPATAGRVAPMPERHELVRAFAAASVHAAARPRPAAPPAVPAHERPAVPPAHERPAPGPRHVEVPARPRPPAVNHPAAPARGVAPAHVAPAPVVYHPAPVPAHVAGAKHARV